MSVHSEQNGPALPSLFATFAVQTLAATAMFGVSVVASVAAPEIGVDATLIGTFTAIAYASGLVIGLLTGALADRFGAIRICQLTMVFALMGCALLALSTPLAALASAVALGFSYGPVNPVSTHILARVVPERSRPFYFSVKQTGMPAGAALAGAVLPIVVAAYDWRIAIVSAGLAAALVAFLIQPLRRPLDAIRNPHQPIRAGNLLKPLALVWKTPRLRSLGLMGFVYSGSQVAIATFYVVYLTSELSMTLTRAGLVYMFLQISAVLGRLFWGAIADRLVPANRLLVGIGIATAVFSLLAGSFAADSPVWLVGGVSFLLGITSSGWNGLFFSELVKHAPKGRTGDAAGGLQFATLAGVACLPPLFGFLVSGTESYFFAFAAAAGLVACAACQFAWSFRR